MLFKKESNMKRLTQIKKVLCFLSIFFTNCYAHSVPTSFNQQQVKADFDALYESLISTHYNPYAYVSEQEFKQTYLSLQEQISDSSYSLLETAKLYQRLVSAIKNGHTTLDFPASSYFQYSDDGGKVFPLDLALEGDRAYIRANYSEQESIPHGAEVIAINGQPMATVLNKIRQLISAERRYFSNTKLEVLSFPRYYWYAFGQQKEFNVEIKAANKSLNYLVKGVYVYDGFEAKKDEMLRAQQQLSFFDETAYLNPGHFSGDEQKFQLFIDNSFSEIKSKSAYNLIIDLRYNSGGNDSFSDYVVAYLADKPFKWYSSFSLRTSQLLKADTKKNRDLSNPYWRSIMKNEDGAVYKFEFDNKYPVTKEKRFQGKVYVLINRHTHSQASVTAAQLQDYGLATIVGEETGDYPSLYASQFQYTLPETEITVRISKGYIVRVNGSEAPEGVMPDITIKDKLRDDSDEILNGLLKQISE